MNPVTGTIGKDDFLRLFTTQLKYQNPLKPMDSTEFTSQLAQFSSLEQLVGIGDKLDGILSYQDSLNNAFATNLMGKMVTVDGNRVQLKGSAAISYEVPHDVEKMTLNINNSSGEVVRTIELGKQPAGDGKYTWDGTDNNGNPLPDGPYTMEFTATDADGKSVPVSTETLAMVTGISFEDGITYLVLDNDTRVSLGKIKEIWKGGV
ncbi:Flagellar basal-body rod modification protein FlgD [hydrothermal vent metagenome]|uniref:Flagellar basal-body rod modification protein FlgD n=1 Tax=hydrothermal vent metagenome TaxID=652676 RepID=A0A3B1CTC2_9ZZZZ